MNVRHFLCTLFGRPFNHSRTNTVSPSLKKMTFDWGIINVLTYENTDQADGADRRSAKTSPLWSSPDGNRRMCDNEGVVNFGIFRIVRSNRPCPILPRFTV